MNTMSKVLVGITGGIGSGKSVVSKILKIIGYPVYDSDTEARRLNEQDPDVKQQLMAAFGEDIYADGKLNKPKLASLIFQSDENRLLVNSIVHPAVKRDFLQWAERQQTDIVFLEAAILYESGFNEFMNKVVAVTAPEDVRVQRAIKRDNATEQQVVNRIHSQMNQDELARMADYVVVNDNCLPLLPQVEALVNNLKQ